MKLLKNPWGYAMLIAVPLITMLVFQLIRMAKVSAEDAANKEQKKDNATLSKEELEAEIARRAVEDFIAEQNKKNAVEQGSQPPDCFQSCQNAVEQGNQSPDCPQSCQNAVEQDGQSSDCPQHEDIAQPSAPDCFHPDRNTDQSPDCSQSCQNAVEQGSQPPDCPQHEDIAQPSAPDCSHPNRNTDPRQDDKNID